MTKNGKSILILFLLIIFSTYSVSAKVQVKKVNTNNKPVVKKLVPSKKVVKKAVQVKPAVKKVILPQVVVSGIPSILNKGETPSVNVFSTDYNGNVQFKIIISKAESKGTINVTNGYSKNINSKSTFMTKLPIITSEGNYILTAYVRRAGQRTAYDNLCTKKFSISKDVILNKVGQTYGPSSGTLSISGNINASANNIKLKNINLDGTVIIDPGKNGTAYLDNVTASVIEVRSGGVNSIHLNNVNSQNLKIYNKSNEPIRIASTGGTKISNTFVNSSVILQPDSGSLGIVLIKNEGVAQRVYLMGKFTDPVIVNSSASITAAPNSNIEQLQISPDNNETITLQGEYGDVEINKNAKVEISGKSNIKGSLSILASVKLTAAADSEINKLDISPIDKSDIQIQGNINTLEVNGEANINILQGSKINTANINSKANMNLASGAVISKVEDPKNLLGAQDDQKLPDNSNVNPQDSATTTPSAISTPPATSTGVPTGSVPATPPANADKPVVEHVGLSTSANSGALIQPAGSGYNYSVDLKNYADDTCITRIFITMSKNCTINIEGTAFTFTAHVQKQIKIPSDFGVTDNPPEGISLSSLRKMGSQITLGGVINDGVNPAITVNVTIKY